MIGAAAAAANHPDGIHLYPAASAAGAFRAPSAIHQGLSRPLTLVHVPPPPGLPGLVLLWVGPTSAREVKGRDDSIGCVLSEVPTILERTHSKSFFRSKMVGTSDMTPLPLRHRPYGAVDGGDGGHRWRRHPIASHGPPRPTPAHPDPAHTLGLSWLG